MPILIIIITIYEVLSRATHHCMCTKLIQIYTICVTTNNIASPIYMLTLCCIRNSKHVKPISIGRMRGRFKK